MPMLLLSLLLYAAAIAALIVGPGPHSPLGIALFVGGLVYTLFGWILFLGLKVLRPQEALVLTLFGKYMGTLKEDGFYWVNPFCSAINPAAETKLKQSGDVDGTVGSLLQLSAGARAARRTPQKRYLT